jgi:hypothetical protein
VTSSTTTEAESPTAVVSSATPAGSAEDACFLRLLSAAKNEEMCENGNQLRTTVQPRGILLDQKREHRTRSHSTSSIQSPVVIELFRLDFKPADIALST